MKDRIEGHTELIGVKESLPASEKEGLWYAGVDLY